MDRNQAVKAILKASSAFAITILFAFVFVDLFKDHVPF